MSTVGTVGGRNEFHLGLEEVRQVVDDGRYEDGSDGEPC